MRKLDAGLYSGLQSPQGGGQVLDLASAFLLSRRLISVPQLPSIQFKLWKPTVGKCTQPHMLASRAALLLYFVNRERACSRPTQSVPVPVHCS